MAKGGKAPMAADEGYCVKCKAKRKISNPQQVKMANGRPALKGVCLVCGTGMFTILPPKYAANQTDNASPRSSDAGGSSLPGGRGDPARATPLVGVPAGDARRTHVLAVVGE